MLQKTNGLVLRSIKYGDSSLIATIFTNVYGTQTYMVRGVRSAKTSRNRGAFFQPGTLLELVVNQQPQKNLQHLREFQPAYIYQSIQEHVVKNSITLFSVELLLRLLPEHAPMPYLFDMVSEYLVDLDKTEAAETANMPLFFVIQCSRMLGYDIKGAYSETTPHLNLVDGGFTDHPPAAPPYVSGEDAAALNTFLEADTYEPLKKTPMSAATRSRLIDWYIAFLKLHTQHMGNMRSLSVLQAILH